MIEPEGLPLEHMRVLAARAGFSLTDAELESLRPMWEHYLKLIRELHAAPVGDEDPAVAFSPGEAPEAGEPA